MSNRALISSLRSVMRFEEGLDRDVRPVTPPVGVGFVAAVARHRVAHVLAPHAEALGLSEDTTRALRAVNAQSTLMGMRTAVGTVQVSEILSSHGVPHLALKGVALALQTTGLPAGRGGGDIDILVAPESLREAVQVLERNGVTQDRRYAPAPDSPLFPAVMRTQQELLLWHGNTEVDLHWRLDCTRGCLTWQFEELLRRADDVDIGGASLRTLARSHATIFNASNAARDAWSILRALVDQARLLRGADEADVRSEAYRVGAGRRFDLSLLLRARLIGLEAPTTDRLTRSWADRISRWLIAGEEPAKRPGLRAASRLSAANFLTHDAPRTVLQRSGTWIWPVRAMAVRELGRLGDDRPWLYPATAPYFASRRALERGGVREVRR